MRARWLVVGALVVASACACSKKQPAAGAEPGSGSGMTAGSGSSEGSGMATGSGSDVGSGAGGSGSGAGSGGAPEMPEVANAGPGFLYVKGKDYEGVIAAAGDWTPSPQDVATVEAVLGPAIAAHALGKDRPASAFKREYGGVNLNGAKVVRVQLACDVEPGWQQKGVPAVRGGGTCYGAADFDVATGKLTRLDANSPR